MALTYNNEPVKWTNEGTAPSDNLKTNGFQAGYKPSAAVFNNQWHVTGECIDELQDKLSAENTARTTHESNKSNPHGVTKSQVGLGNVDNTSDANKPISSATQTALNSKADKSNTPITVGTKDETVNIDNNGTATIGENAIKIGVNRNDYYSRPITPGSTTGWYMTDRVKVAGSNSLAIGDYLYAIADRTVAIGSYNDATANTAVSIGYQNKANGESSCAIGTNNKASAIGTTTRGVNNTASGKYGTAIGYSNDATGDWGSVALGYNNTSSGDYAVSMGCENEAKYYATAFGYHNTADLLQFKLGKYSKSGSTGTLAGATGDALIVGNGSADDTRSNCFRVGYDGYVYGGKTFGANAADIAELYEWQDGNPNNEDRRGLFVTLDGTKIKLASPTDTYIKGVISALPCLVGDAYSDDWQGKYLKDVFGVPLTHIVHHEAEYKEIETVDPETGEKTTETICVIEAYDAEEYILNPDYDPTKEYVPREQRPEFDYVSNWGKLVLVDDGTCEVNGFATVGNGGKATKADKQTAYRVMERRDDTHIYVSVG